MGPTGNVLLALAFGALIVSLALAALVLRPRPVRARNQLLAALILVEGVANLGWAVGAAAEDPDLTVQVFRWWGLPGFALFPWLYLLFLSRLDSPLARPLRGPGTALVVLGAAALQLWLLARPRDFLEGVVPSESLSVPNTGVGYHVASGVFLVAIGYGLAVAISSYRRSRTDAARARARTYVLAFGVRDVLFLVTILAGAYLDTTGRMGEPIALVVPVLFFAAAILFGALLTYGVLHNNLFDVDLRIKAGLRRTLVAGLFVAVFFVVSQVVQNLLNEQLGLVAGGVAAGLLLFALQPLQDLAGRIADKAMPDVHPSSAYVTYRKMHVYRAALEEALSDGHVREKERRLLERLAAELGILPADAAALEADVVHGRAPVVGSVERGPSGEPATAR